MNKAAITKHTIYNNLDGLSEKDLASIANYIEFMRHQKKLKAKKIIKLQGILSHQKIDFTCLETFKNLTWQHVEHELGDA